MSYIFAGFFGVHGWPFGIILTWILFVANFLVLRYCTVTDIFRKIPRRWHWALVSFRLGIAPGRGRYRRIARTYAPYLCPGNYLCGTIAVYAFRRLALPAAISKTICFIANKSLMLHLLDCVFQCFGSQIFDMFRSSERIRPPTMAIVNTCLVTVQILFLGIFLEIYRERLFSVGLEFASCLSDWINVMVPFPLSIWRQMKRAWDSRGKLDSESKSKREE
jgi:hypothetical protein